MERHLRRALPLAALGLAAVAPNALAGHPGSWTRISSGTVDTLARPAAARTGDGVLHALWVRTYGTLAVRLVDSRVRQDGVAKPAVLATTTWRAMQDPALVVEPDGSLRAFLPGQRTAVTGAANEWLSTLTAPASGAAWALSPVDVTNGDGAYAFGVSALRTAGGDHFQAWSAFAHESLVDATAHHQIGFPPTLYIYDPALAQDGVTGQVWTGFFADATGHHGAYAQRLQADATPAPASAIRLPGTGTVLYASTLTPLASRGPGKAGVYEAYPAGYPYANRLLVWKVGAAKATTLRALGQAEVLYPALARGHGGRLWAAWIEHVSATTRDVLLVRRSNASATGWGATVRVPIPGGVVRSVVLEGTGATTTLDVLANFDPAGAATRGIFHTQVQPGLGIGCVVGSRVAGGRRVTCTVRDAGAAVGGAKVRSGAVVRTTNGSGVAVLVLAAGRRTITVTKSGYALGSVRVTVKP